ncbi:hypothetical protein ACRQ5Q_15120 [Bradyrhizobium sp. PMVTL-01]|uniref:hypothetical protein n=1 Tax=Bradyrhizobium sp. PMVTL-01 TaxID=3434999 RepID=UPI003F70CB57
MAKQKMSALDKSVQARARDMAAKRIQTASSIARAYVEASMRIMFPGEEVD